MARRIWWKGELDQGPPFFLRNSWARRLYGKDVLPKSLSRRGSTNPVTLVDQKRSLVSKILGESPLQCPVVGTGARPHIVNRPPLRLRSYRIAYRLELGSIPWKRYPLESSTPPRLSPEVNGVNHLVLSVWSGTILRNIFRANRLSWSWGPRAVMIPCDSPPERALNLREARKDICG